MTESALSLPDTIHIAEHKCHTFTRSVTRGFNIHDLESGATFILTVSPNPGLVQGCVQGSV